MTELGASPMHGAAIECMRRTSRRQPVVAMGLACACVFVLGARQVCSEESARALDSEQQIVARRAAGLSKLPPKPVPPRIGNATLHPIDAFIAAKWPEASQDPKPRLCDKATYLRRVYLDAIGAIPTWIEANRFLAGKDSQEAREKLVDQLLSRNEDYAAHWTAFWEDALASQNVLSQGGILTRGNYRQWLLASFEQNRPFDVMVAELIDPTMPRRQGAESKEVLGTTYPIEFVRNEDHTVTLQTAANIGQVFLGTSMKCASCHDHFENDEWPQTRFLAFAGLFAPHDLERIRCEHKTGEIVAAKFPFELPGMSAEIPQDTTARLHLAARLITDPANPRFAKTIVNRLWKRYFGLGLFEPVDDFRLDTPASHPELLEWLAYDFIEHGCDLKHTTRQILASRAYQLRYDPELADHYNAGHGSAPRYFRSPSLRRLTAEQFLDSIRVAISGELSPATRCYLDARSTALARALGRPASRNEISTNRPDDVAVVQSLELLNGHELQQILNDCKFDDTLLRQDERRQVDRLYRAALSRPATVDEKNLGRAFLQGAPSPEEGLRDMLWALICSPEFQYIK